MADRIRVSTEAMEDLMSQVRKLASDLDAIQSDIRGVRMDRSSGADLKIDLPSRTIGSINRRLRSGEAEDCLRDIAGITQALEGYAGNLAQKIKKASDLFIQNEERQIRTIDGLNSQESLFDGICQALGFSKDTSSWTPAMHDKYQQLLENADVVVDDGMTLIASDGKSFIFGKDGLLASYEEDSSFTKKKQTFKLHGKDNWVEIKNEEGLKYAGARAKKDFLERTPIEDLSYEGSFDKDGNKVEKPKRGLAVGILGVGATTGVSGNLWGQHGAIEGEKGKLEGSVSLGNAEVHASGNAGFGVYLPNENGELELYFGGEGEIGGSVNVAQAEGSFEYELCDYVELGGKGEVSLLEAEAKAKGGLGIVDGEFAAYGEASAEALVAKAEGEVSLDVGGVKGTAGGSVSFGLGAHAKAGYNDGVISVDVGVAVGPGVSGYVELDIGGLVDNIADGAQDAVNAISGFFGECAWW